MPTEVDSMNVEKNDIFQNQIKFYYVLIGLQHASFLFAFDPKLCFQYRKWTI